MKKILLSILFASIAFIGFGQDDDVEPTCYQKYATVFEKRGAHPIADGVYDDVIISFRKGSSADCFYGKVTVQNSVIIKSEIYLKFEDNSYEKVERIYKHEDDIVGIINGISKTMVTMDDELINVLFVSKIKPKKKSYVRAKEPDFDL
jgi:hypothetical protein